MQDRQFIAIAVAARRWRDAQRRRLDACREKRLAQEAERATRAFYDPRIGTNRAAADKAVTATKRAERNALKALAKLCDQAMHFEDALIVEEVQALPHSNITGNQEQPL